MSRSLAILGIAFLVVVVLTHIAERWHFFPEMGWGLKEFLKRYATSIGSMPPCPQ